MSDKKYLKLFEDDSRLVEGPWDKLKDYLKYLKDDPPTAPRVDWNDINLAAADAEHSRNQLYIDKKNKKEQEIEAQKQAKEAEKQQKAWDKDVEKQAKEAERERLRQEKEAEKERKHQEFLAKKKEHGEFKHAERKNRQYYQKLKRDEAEAEKARRRADRDAKKSAAEQERINKRKVYADEVMTAAVQKYVDAGFPADEARTKVLADIKLRKLKAARMIYAYNNIPVPSDSEIEDSITSFSQPKRGGTRYQSLRDDCPISVIWDRKTDKLSPEYKLHVDKKEGDAIVMRNRKLYGELDRNGKQIKNGSVKPKDASSAPKVEPVTAPKEPEQNDLELTDDDIESVEDDQSWNDEDVDLDDLEEPQQKKVTGFRSDENWGEDGPPDDDEYENDLADDEEVEEPEEQKKEIGSPGALYKVIAQWIAEGGRTYFTTKAVEKNFHLEYESAKKILDQFEKAGIITPKYNGYEVVKTKKESVQYESFELDLADDEEEKKKDVLKKITAPRAGITGDRIKDAGAEK